jgi:arylsulfatase A-like enzyme/Flp pilus assembly protein TadD
MSPALPIPVRRRSRRRAIGALVAVGAALGLGAVLALAGCRADRPPPIVLVSIDTLRADRLPDWGYGAGRTPHLSALVRDGIRFENAYAQVPLTLPSHVSLFTGLLPPDAGVRSNLGYRFDAARHRSLPEALRSEAGYATGGFVSAYVLRRETGLAEPFDRYDDAMEVSEASTLGALQRPGAETVARALEWLGTLRQEQPYFLFVHLFEPHYPYEPPEPWRSQLGDPYDGEIASADAALGQLLEGLRKRGDLGRAVVAVFSDHGEGLGDHGESEHGVLLYREALHVPLVLKLPGERRAGATVAAPAALVDLFPTLAGIARLRPVERAAGRSLLSLGDEGQDAGRRIYSETLYPRLHLGWSELRSLTDGRFQAIVGPDPELYDIVADPREKLNLRSDRRREYAEREAELAAIPLDFAPPAPASAEEMARLQALGYLGGSPATGSGELPDPKAHIGLIGEVQRVFALTGEGKLDEALALSVRLLGERPDLLDVRNQLAGLLRRLGRFEEALAVYAETERRFPQLAESFAIERAKLELDLGRLDGAEAAARQALTANPLEARLVLAAVAVRRGDWAAAADEARQGVGDPSHPRVPALLLLAQALAADGKLEEARVEIERARERSRDATRPGGARPVATLEATYGDILARLGRVGEAEAAFRREIERFPRNPDPYVRLAILLASEHRFGEIEPALEAMVAALPVPRTYLLAAETLERLGNAADAESYRRRARAAKEMAAPSR